MSAGGQQSTRFEGHPSVPSTRTAATTSSNPMTRTTRTRAGPGSGNPSATGTAVSAATATDDDIATTSSRQAQHTFHQPTVTDTDVLKLRDELESKRASEFVQTIKKAQRRLREEGTDPEPDYTSQAIWQDVLERTTVDLASCLERMTDEGRREAERSIWESAEPESTGAKKRSLWSKMGFSGS
ncbi:hypothetical protein I316_00453 [Kwoniella heveanensis BCC8398]|uniref:Uncharacterized protein n=1 Tax=Kwoniella heveanensis BCC8398 TaxID=1296120 RepID=A0A1B9H4N2_9TREE|nr:hypothetical protein I316_00453 [Kwoniella heveanensis BCC8398]